MVDPNGRQGPASGWLRSHFQPTFNLGHVMTTVGILVTGLAWAFGVEGRVDLLEQRLAMVEQLQETRIESIGDALDTMNDRLGRLETALTRRLERIDERIDRVDDLPYREFGP